MNEEIKKKLVALEAEVDAVLFRSMYDDEEKQGMGVGSALKIGAGLGALGAGAYGAKIGDQAIRRKYGMMPGVGRRESYRRAGMDALDAAKGYGAKAKGYGEAAMNQARPGMEAGMKAWQRSGAQRAGMFSRLRRVLGGATRALTGGRFGFSEIEGRLNRLIEMSSPLADFNRTYKEREAMSKAAAADARVAYKVARNDYNYYRKGVTTDPVVEAAREKLRNESHIMRGVGTGAVVGAVGGAAGAAKLRVHPVLGGIYGAASGLIGAGVGAQIGGRIRKKEK